jgi:hypothetical protein
MAIQAAGRLAAAIVEWGVKPLSHDWAAILDESVRGFEERQKVR